MKIIFVFFLSFLFPLLGTQTDIQDVALNNTNETSFESVRSVNAVMDVAINNTTDEWDVMYYGNVITCGFGQTALTPGTDCSTGIKVRYTGAPNCDHLFTAPSTWQPVNCAPDTDSVDFDGEVASPTICAANPGFVVYTKITITFND